jgi:solute:Na+ symporter, SSS family
MTLLPSGLKGLVFAALLAAIVSSLASMSNSISTLFTMDLLPSLRSADKQGDPVKVGRTVAVIAMVLAMLTAEPLLGKFDQAFQYIQEFTGFFTPGIVVIFLLGMFWKKTTAAGALAAAVGSVALSFLFKMVWPELPFIDRVGLVFLIAAGLAIIVSLIENRVQQGAIELSEIEFGTTQGFNLSALAVTLILAALYATWW